MIGRGCFDRRVGNLMRSRQAAAECLAGGTFFLAAFWFVILAGGERDLLLRVVRQILRRP